MSDSSQHSNLEAQNCIVKSIPKHWHLRNEAGILKRYQSKTSSIRPLIDEIQEPAEPASIVLQYLDTDLLRESNRQRLSRAEIKQVARTTLGALKVLHEDGLVHTGINSPVSPKMPFSQGPTHEILTRHLDIKLDNIFVNLGKDGQRFSAIQLGDCGGVVPEKSEFARDGHLIGAVITRSPETMLGLRWGTATDIWSFGSSVSQFLLALSTQLDY